MGLIFTTEVSRPESGLTAKIRETGRKKQDDNGAQFKKNI
jgi:hypothetical protein